MFVALEMGGLINLDRWDEVYYGSHDNSAEGRGNTFWIEAIRYEPHPESWRSQEWEDSPLKVTPSGHLFFAYNEEDVDRAMAILETAIAEGRPFVDLTAEVRKEKEAADEG